MEARDVARNRAESAASSERSVPVDDALDRFAAILQSANADPRAIYDELFALAIASGGQQQQQSPRGPHGGADQKGLQGTNGGDQGVNAVCTDQHTIARLLTFVLEKRLGIPHLLKVVSKLQVAAESIVRGAFRFGEQSAGQRVMFDYDDMRLLARLAEYVHRQIFNEPQPGPGGAYWDGSAARLGGIRPSVVFVHPAMFVRRSRDAFLRTFMEQTRLASTTVQVMKLRRSDIIPATTMNGNVPVPPRRSSESAYVNVSELTSERDRQQLRPPRRSVWSVDVDWFAAECARLRANGMRPMLAYFCVGEPDAACGAFDDSPRLSTLVRIAAHYGCWSHVMGMKTALLALLQPAFANAAGQSAVDMPNSVGVSLGRVLNDAFVPDCVLLRDADSRNLERSLSDCGFERELETPADLDTALRRVSHANRLERYAPGLAVTSASGESVAETEGVSVLEPRAQEAESLASRIGEARLKAKLARRFGMLFETWLSLIHAVSPLTLTERIARRFETMRYLEARLARCEYLLLLGAARRPGKSGREGEEEMVIEARSLGELFSTLTQLVVQRPQLQSQKATSPGLQRPPVSAYLYELLNLYPPSVTFKFTHNRMTTANRDTLNRWLFETLRRGGVLHGGVPVRLVNLHEHCLPDESPAEHVWFAGNFFHIDAFEFGDWSTLERQRGAAPAEAERAVRQLDTFCDALEQNCSILSYTQSQKELFVKEVERSGCMKVYETASPDWPGLGCVLYVVRKLRADAQQSAASNQSNSPKVPHGSTNEPAWTSNESGYRTETSSLVSNEQPGAPPTPGSPGYDWKTAGYIQMTESDLEYSNLVTREIVARLRRHDKAYSLGVTYLRSAIPKAQESEAQTSDNADDDEQDAADAAQDGPDSPLAAADSSHNTDGEKNTESNAENDESNAQDKKDAGEETSATHQLFYIRFGLILAGSNVLDVVDAVRAVGQEIEAHHEYLRTMSDRVLEGIRNAEQQLDEEYINTIREEGILRNLPVIGSMINWWSPLPSRENRMKGRTLDLQSGRMASTDLLMAGTKRYGADPFGEHSRMKVHGGAPNADTISISSGDADVEHPALLPPTRMWRAGAPPIPLPPRHGLESPR